MATSAFTGLVKKLFSVGDHAVLRNDLDNNPVLQHALCVLSGEIYHRFGLGVAPLSLMLTTVQHVDVTRPKWVAQRDHLDITCQHWLLNKMKKIQQLKIDRKKADICDFYNAREHSRKWKGKPWSM